MDSLSNLSLTAPKTVAVLGAAYGGRRAVQILLEELPADWRVVVIDRNTHFNHLYAFPRMAILKDQQEKPFIPYTKILKAASAPMENVVLPQDRHLMLHAEVTKVEQNCVYFKTLTGHHDEAVNANNPYKSTEQEHSLDFDYCIYGLGSHLPAPINVRLGNESKGTKIEGCKWLGISQDRIEKAGSVLIIGGGALGVQMATDIADIYGKEKKVTLMHSREQLLPRFRPWMHEQVMEKLKELGVNIVLSSRADLSTYNKDDTGVKEGRTIQTLDGKTLEADLILLCTGQKPNTEPLQASSQLSPSINPTSGLVSVNRNLQISPDSGSVLSNFYVIGDVADAFGALKAGHTAWGMGEMAARNINRQIRNEKLLLQKKNISTNADADADATKAETEDTTAKNGLENENIIEKSSSSSDEDDEVDLNVEPLEEYNPPPFAIKVSLGLKDGIIQRDGGHLRAEPENCHEDLHCSVLWEGHGFDTSDYSR